MEEMEAPPPQLSRWVLCAAENLVCLQQGRIQTFPPSPPQCGEGREFFPWAMIECRVESSEIEHALTATGPSEGRGSKQQAGSPFRRARCSTLSKRGPHHHQGP